MDEGPYRYVQAYASKTSPFMRILVDIGTITILWSQPVSGLQIQCPDGQWRWVRHIENALVRFGRFPSRPTRSYCLPYHRS